MAEGLELLRNYILENGEISSDTFMKLMELCFQYCRASRESELYLVVAESFIELRNRKLANLARVQEVRDYCLANSVPYPEEKNINRKIVNYAFPMEALTLQEMENFMNVADKVRRVCSYLHRFWIPNHRDVVLKFIPTLQGTHLPITTFDQLALHIWPEIISMVLKKQKKKEVQNV